MKYTVKQIADANKFAQSVVDAINGFLEFDAASIGQHNECGEICGIICESEPVDFCEFPNIGEGFKFQLPEAPAGLFAEAYSSWRLNIWPA